MTLAAYAPTWLATIRRSVRPSTFAFYRTLAEVHLADIGHYRVARISPPIVRSLIERMEAEGYASRTIRGVLDVLRQVLRQAMADGIVDRNVVELVRRPRLDTKEPVYFTAEEARRFLDAVVTMETAETAALYALALGSGLRRGELLALQWRDVDLALRMVTVRSSKTSAGVRRIPIPGFAVERLEVLPRQPGPIFRVSPSYATRHVAVICRRAGLPVVGMHALRHSAASILYAEGVPDFTVQAILGHTKASMTRHYTHVEEEQRREAMERLGRAVGS